MRRGFIAWLGEISFEESQLVDNIEALIRHLNSIKPATQRVSLTLRQLCGQRQIDAPRSQFRHDV